MENEVSGDLGIKDKTLFQQLTTMDEKEADKSCIRFERTELKRRLTLFNVVAMMVSITGHVAIFMIPGSIMATSGSVATSIIVWFVGGFFVYTLALCFAELGTIYQRAGGPYLYITLVFGPLPGFLMAWGYILLISGPFLAWTSYTTAVYIVRATVDDDHGCANDLREVGIKILAGLINVILMYLNCRHLKFVVRAQTILTVTKMIMILVIILAGLYISLTDRSSTFEEPMADATTDPGRIALAILIVVFSNGGWQAVTTLTEEVKNPARTLPLAIHMTFAFSVGVNFLTFVAYMMVLEVSQIKTSDTIAILFWQRIFPPLVPVVSVAVAMASIGALNTGMMGHSRVLMAAARKGVMPSILGTLHPTLRTPMVSLCVITCYGLLMSLVGSPDKMVQFVGLFSFIMGLFISLAVVHLRMSQPNLPRPYKVPLGYAVLQVLVNTGMLVLVVYQEPGWMLLGVLVFLAGVPVYLFARWSKPGWLLNWTGKLTSLIQKILVQVPSE